MKFQTNELSRDSHAQKIKWHFMSLVVMEVVKLVDVEDLGAVKVGKMSRITTGF